LIVAAELLWLVAAVRILWFIASLASHVWFWPIARDEAAWTVTFWTTTADCAASCAWSESLPNCS
jgi:hypothetical protein